MKPGALTWMFAALGLLLAVPTHAADTVYYYSSDTLHSEVVVTDANRNVVERTTHYAPYGQVLNRDLRDGPGYGGHEEDPETSLVYMQQRYYDPEAGRFLSTDPVQADGGGGSFNRYEYANDNPYRYTDPDGRESGAGYATGEYTMALPPSSPEARDAALTTAGIVVVVAGAMGADEAVGAGVLLRAGVRYVGAKVAGAVVRRAVARAGKQAIKLTSEQEKNVGRFAKKVPANAKESISMKRLQNDGIAVQARSPGRVSGSSAVYEKQIDSSGKTIQYTKTTYDPDGNIVHVKDKLGGNGL